MAENECIIVSNHHVKNVKNPIAVVLHSNKVDYVRQLTAGYKQLSLALDTTQHGLSHADLDELSTAVLNAINGINTGSYQIQKGKAHGGL